MLLSEAFGRWLAATDAKVSTQKTYARSIRHFMGAGLSFVEDIRVESVAEIVKGMKARGLRNRTIACELAALTSVLTRLTLERSFSADELNLIRKLKPRQKSRQIGTARWLANEEAARLVEASKVIAPRLELAIRVALLCGPRVGELARMKREDFSLGKNPHVRITNLHEHGERGSAKTGERTVPVCGELKELVLERGPKSGWFFPVTERKGGRKAAAPFMSRWTFEYEMQFVRRGAGLGPEVTFTTLRHTRASTWLQANVSIWKVSAWLGHSVFVCERAYGGIGVYDPDVERTSAPPIASPDEKKSSPGDEAA